MNNEGQNDRDLTVGTKIGPYRIETMLGEGGMGIVYRALDTKLNRPVAIKFLSSKLADANARRRFQREAQMASSLNHPHILTVHDIGEFEGREYLVTEFVDSGTVRDWARGKRTWRQVVELMVGVADGLAAAHAAGITHRDIKPANILVAANGYAKLADFGLAKLTETTPHFPADEAPTVDLTLQGVVVGTLAYMSPEQASGQTLDTRSDIFSFGVVLYELLAGRRPFGGRTDLEVMQTIIHGEAEPLRDEIPVALRLAVDKALAKDPAERYQSMREMVVDFRRLAHQVGETPAAGLRRTNRRFQWAWVALLPVLLGLAYFGWQTWRAPRSSEPLQATALTTLPGVERYPSFSPDGDRVVFTWTGTKQDNPDIYVQQVGSGSPLKLTTDPGSDFSPAWSPDGRHIAFLRHKSPAMGNLGGTAELRIVPPLGGTERKLAEIHMAPEFFSAPKYLSWCSDSTCLVVSEATGLFLIPLDTTDKTRLTTALPGGSGDTDPAVSPDGRSLAFRRAFTLGVNSLYWLPLGKGPATVVEPRRLTFAPLNATSPAWTPDGEEIVFSSSGSLWRLASPRHKSGENLPARLPFVGEDGVMPIITRIQGGKTSRLAYVRSSVDSNIWRVETSGPGVPSTSSSSPVVSISSTRGEAHAQISPDGRRLSYSSNRSGDWEIWVSDSDGSNTLKLTSMGALTTNPTWSPDGQQIAFHSNVEGQFEIYLVPISGGKPVRLTSDPRADGFPSFSRDGRWIYFQSMRSGQIDIWKVPVSGGDAIQVTHNTGGNASESLDGHVYYLRNAGAEGALWRLPVSGGQPVKVLDGVSNGSFAVVEKGIYFLNRTSGENQLRFFDLAIGKSTTVARNLGEVFVGAGLAASPDGRTILYSRVDSSVEDLMLVENFR